MAEHFYSLLAQHYRNVFYVRVCITKKNVWDYIMTTYEMFLMKIHENKMQNYRQRNCNYLNNDLCIKYTQCEILQFMVIAS